MEGFKKYDWINKEGQPTEEGKYLVLIPKDDSENTTEVIEDEWKDGNFVKSFRVVIEYKKLNK